MPNVYVINKFQDNPYPHAVEVDTTSRGPFKDLSPFYLGPVVDPYTGETCQIFENYWQYSKVYHEHVDINGNFTQAYQHWRTQGFNATRANRYPMGKGRKPMGTLFGNRILPYIEARKLVYAPFYADLVIRTHSYALLYKWLVDEQRDLVLRDFDGYDYMHYNMSLVDVINYSVYKMGHAFIIAGLLTGRLEAMKQ